MKRGACAESPFGESESPGLVPQPPSPVTEPVSHAPWSARSAIAVWLVSLALSLALGIVLALTELFTGATIPLILSTAIGELGFLTPPLFYAVATGAGLGSLGFRLKGSLKAVALGLVVAFPSWLVFLVVSIPVELILPPPEWLIDLFLELAPRTPLELLLTVLVTLALVAPSEEILSRGFVQQGIENTFGRRRGLLVSSILFGIMHLNPWQGVGAVFIALIWGYCFQTTDYNLLTPITAHVVHNSITYVLVFLGLF